ncbi:MAG: transglycosylase domain-containing protein [Candidatus Aminicenantes bacterium]|nr:transglycosylase domain-containing protein [Candidatus Aminicenantes bacterium]
MRMKKISLPAFAPRTKRTLRIGARVLLGAMLAVSVLFFSLRNVILNDVLDKKIGTYLEQHQRAVCTVGMAKFYGLDRVVIENIRLRSSAGTIAVNLRSCSIKLGLWNLLLGSLRPEVLQIDDLRIRFQPGGRQYPGPSGPANGKEPRPRPSRKPAFSAQVQSLLQLIFRYIPDTLRINRFTFSSDIDHIRQTFHVPQFVVQTPAFATLVEIQSRGKTWACRLDGNIDRKKKELSVRLAPLHPDEKIFLPFIDRQWGIRVSLGLAEISLRSGGLHRGELQLQGVLAVNGLTLNHPRIAVEDVNLQNAALDYVLRIGTDCLELDERTQVQFNRLAFHPYLKFTARPTEQLTLRLKRTAFKADDLFGSLPAGLFSRLAGIRTSGELSYEFDFFIDFTRPGDLSLHSDLQRSAFRIERFGRVDFSACAAPFMYTAYEKNRAVRSFMVGSENPDFRSLDQFPPFLKNAVLISEDGAFFGHKGFLLGPFKESIAANIREKRFVRGASTISMQLVKNLFLKKDKTIARKLEEMLITWLIEEKRLLSKERMYEIYLNIIEWGPLVYGATEAARFYFDKDVAKLTLAEAIFMASIIPRPKRFMYWFGDDQRLRPWLQAYYSDVSTKMLARGMIGQQDFDTLLSDIRLKGPARFLLKGGETLPAEELWPDEETPD